MIREGGIINEMIRVGMMRRGGIFRGGEMMRENNDQRG